MGLIVLQRLYGDERHPQDIFELQSTGTFPTVTLPNSEATRLRGMLDPYQLDAIIGADATCKQS